MRQPPDAASPDAEAALLARAYQLIISWSDNESETTPAEGAGEAARPDDGTPGVAGYDSH